MSDNPAKMRVYYDEDINDLSEDEIRDQLNEEVSSIDGVIDVQVEKVFGSRQSTGAKVYEAILTVEFDGMETSSAEVQQEASLFPFLHNARIR